MNFTDGVGKSMFIQFVNTFWLKYASLYASKILLKIHMVCFSQPDERPQDWSPHVWFAFILNYIKTNIFVRLNNILQLTNFKPYIDEIYLKKKKKKRKKKTKKVSPFSQWASYLKFVFHIWISFEVLLKHQMSLILRSLISDETIQCLNSSKFDNKRNDKQPESQWLRWSTIGTLSNLNPMSD